MRRPWLTPQKKKILTQRAEADTSNLPRRRGDVIEEAQFEDAGRNKKIRSNFNISSTQTEDGSVMPCASPRSTSC
jgi:hypothetical protein